MKRQSGKIEAKDCDGYGDPICNYICHNGSITHKKEKVDSNPDGTDREKNNDKIICDGSTNDAYTYECNGNNIVRKTDCPNGCADDHKGCKQDSDLTDKCTEKDPLICKGEALFDCRNAQGVVTPVANNMVCDEKGQVVYCDKSIVTPKMYTCAGDQVVWCKKDEFGEYRLHTSECYPNDDKNTNKDVCKSKQSTNTCTQCSDEGNCVAQGTDADQKVSCKEDLTGITPYTGTTGIECQYCYNKDVNNTPVSIGELGCKGCVPNKYTPRDGTGSTLNPKDEVCYNGKLEQFGNAEGGNFLHVPKSNSNELWQFALNVTPALSKEQSETPPTDQFVDTPNAPSKDHSVVPSNDQSKQTWQYYNCYNDAAMNYLTKHPNVNNANDLSKFLKNLNKCCDDENSYYITQTGYRYYSVEKCTNIRLQNANNDIIDTNFSAYAYTPELNDFLIGTEHDLLAEDYACLEAKDSNDEGGEASVRRMMFIKQKTNGEQENKDGEPKHGIYKAFECPEKYECDESLNPRLCISNDNSHQNCSQFKCNTNNTIFCYIGSKKMTVAACPEGTTLSIVGDSGQSSCEGQPNLKLDQIQCVPNSKSTSE